MYLCPQTYIHRQNLAFYVVVFKSIFKSILCLFNMSDVVEMLKCLRLGRSLWQKEIKTCQKLLSPTVSQNLNSVQRVMCSTFLGCQPATADILYYGCNSWVAEDWPKMRALGGVAEHTQPTIAVPLAQSSATGKLAVSSGRKKPPSKIWFPILNK